MKQLIEKYVKIWNTNKPQELEKVFSQNSNYWDSLQQGEAIGLLTDALHSTHQAFPDVLLEIISMEASDERQVFLEWKMTGTNTGEFYGHSPTGKKIEIRGLDAITLEQSRIIEIKSFYDSSLFTQQLEIQ